MIAQFWQVGALVMEHKELEAELGRLVADFRTPVAPPRDYSVRAREAYADAPYEPAAPPVRVPAAITPVESRSWGLIVTVPAAVILFPALAYWLAPSKPTVVAAPAPREIAQVGPVEHAGPDRLAMAPVSQIETRIASAAPVPGAAVPLPRARPKILR